MPTLKFVVPELWHEPELISCFLGTSLVVAAYDFPSRDGIAGAVRCKLLSSESACVIILVRVRTRPIYSHSYYRFIRKKFNVVVDYAFETRTNNFDNLHSPSCFVIRKMRTHFLRLTLTQLSKRGIKSVTLHTETELRLSLLCNFPFGLSLSILSLNRRLPSK